MTKISVGRIVAEAYRFAFVGLERVIGLVWLPIIAMTVIGYFAEGSFLTAYAAAMDSGDTAQLLPAFAQTIGFVVVQLLLQAIIAVTICRDILKPLDRPLWLRFSLGGTEFRAVAGMLGLGLLAAVLIFALALAGMMLGGMLPGGMAAGQQALGVAALLLILFSPLLIYMFVRLGGLLVPSVVVDGGLGLERSWLLLKGNVGRMLLVMLAVSVPMALVFLVGQGLIMGPDAVAPHLPASAADKAAQMRQMAESYRQTAQHLPYLKGLEFILAPFVYGLGCSAPAFIYKALTGTLNGTPST